MSTPGPDDADGFPDLTAGEYVLGVLDAAESAIVRRRLATEPAFAAEVAGWEERLTPLIDQVIPVAPPAAAWESIAQRLHPVRRAQTARRSALWESLNLWRGLAFATTALAAASAAIAIMGRAPQPLPAGPQARIASPPLAVAQLTNPQDGGAVAFTATFDPVRRQLVVTPTGRSGRADRSLELWLAIAGRGPVSLGVLTDRTLVVAAPAGLTPRSTLAVSLEPLGGSRTGAPTGPVIAMGQLTRL